MKKAILISLVLLLGACSDLPEDRAIEDMLKTQILSDGMDGLFALEGFVRTNGFRESDNVYIADVEYDLVFQKSFAEVVDEIRADPTGPQYGPFGSKLLLMAMQSNFGNFEVGDRLHKQQKVRLHRTDKGWIIAGT